MTDEAVNVDDVIETANHFRCIDKVIDCAAAPLTEKLIKELHFILKTGTADSRKAWFAVGDYKRYPNEVGGRETTLPEQVHSEVKALLDHYSHGGKTLEDIIAFHVDFERIHPFQDGNGRVGRLILFKECLKYDIVPFIICLALIMGGPALGVPTMLATRLSFVITGAWWLIFTLPLIRTYKQKYGRERGPQDTIGHIVGGVFSEVGHTMREIAHNKTVLVYMIAFFFYIDGVHTVISMATSYGSALGIDSTQLVLALLVTQFVAFPSAIIYGKLAGRVGTLNMILVAVAAYMGIVLFAAFFLKTAFEFWVLAILVGLFQGGVQALSRSYFGRIIPKEKSNEYYGFFDIFGRYASVMGTFLVSVVTSLTGNPSLGVLSIGVLLVVGFVLLVRLSRMAQAAA